MSLTTALVIALVMIVSTLLFDRGVRPVGRGRVLRPLLVGVPIALFFTAHLVTDGTGLAVEAAGAVLGLLVGTGAALLARVGRDETTGQAVTRAGTAYFAFWIAACVVRFAFSYGAQHWFGQDVGTWLYRHGVALDDISAVITNGIVFSVLGMLLGRAAGMLVRAGTVTRTASVAARPALAR
jgi:hypothetical protein